jgi:hypothetical protein
VVEVVEVVEGTALLEALMVAGALALAFGKVVLLAVALCAVALEEA